VPPQPSGSAGWVWFAVVRQVWIDAKEKAYESEVILLSFGASPGSNRRRGGPLGGIVSRLRRRLVRQSGQRDDTQAEQVLSQTSDSLFHNKDWPFLRVLPIAGSYILSRPIRHRTHPAD